MKKNILLLALIFLAISSALIAANSEKETTIVKVLYFHGPMRCPIDLDIERETRQIVESDYSKEIETGSLSLNVVDFIADTSENYMEMYQLETQALIIAKFEKGKQTAWKNLPKIWEYIGDYSQFSKYICDEVNAYLK